MSLLVTCIAAGGTSQHRLSPVLRHTPGIVFAHGGSQWGKPQSDVLETILRGDNWQGKTLGNVIMGLVKRWVTKLLHKVFPKSGCRDNHGFLAKGKSSPVWAAQGEITQAQVLGWPKAGNHGPAPLLCTCNYLQSLRSSSHSRKSLPVTSRNPYRSPLPSPDTAATNLRATKASTKHPAAKTTLGSFLEPPALGCLCIHVRAWQQLSCLRSVLPPSFHLLGW